jgi:hypothetical protein
MRRCAPPHCSAKLIGTASPFAVGVPSGLRVGLLATLSYICLFPIEAPAGLAGAPVVGRDMYGAGSMEGNAERV